MRKRWLQTIHQLAKKNSDIVFIGSDLSADPAIKKFQEECPQQFFMEGVSEAHIIGMAAGLALTGKTVFINTIATFLTRRCYEQNVVDLGITNAKVRLIGSGGGLVYAPLGPTHLATEDIAIMRAIPNMAVIAVCDADEMQRAIEASIDYPGPIYFRVAKGGDPIVSKPELNFQIGRALVLQEPEGNAPVLFSTGIMLKTALEVAQQYLTQRKVKIGVIHHHTLKPFDLTTSRQWLAQASLALTLEEHVLSGGLGTLLAELIAEDPALRKVVLKRFGLADEFVAKYGSQDSLLKHYRVDTPNVLNYLLAAGS